MITDIVEANTRVCELQEEIDFLKGELGLRVDEVKVAKLSDLFRGRGANWNLGPRGAWMILALYDAGKRGLPQYALLDNLPRQYSRVDEPCMKSVVVYIHRIRKLIGRDCIETIGERGYALTEAGRAKVDALLGAAGALAELLGQKG